jgi:hypothetical protein
VDTVEPEEAWVRQHDEDAEAAWNTLLHYDVLQTARSLRFQ